MMRSDIPIGDSGSLLSRDALMANPTPWILWSASGSPFRKVYPSPCSVREFSSAMRVSLRAAMSILYLLSSDATKAVRLGGLSVSLVELASSKVLIFHAANFIVEVCLLLVFRPLKL